MIRGQGRSQPEIWSYKCKFFSVFRSHKESFSKEMNDDDLNLHSMTKFSGWPRYCAWCTLTSVQADSS